MKKIYHTLGLFLKDQRGVSMVFVALGMFMLVGFTALVVDVGRLYLEKSNLQKEIDAASLVGALKLKETGNEGLAKDEAIRFAADNYSLILTKSNLSTNSHSFKITVDKNNVPMTLAKVLGIDNVNVPATAAASFGSKDILGKKVMPLALLKQQIPSETNLNCEDTVHGNCGYLDLEEKGGGFNELKNAIEAGGVDLNDHKVYTEPGKNMEKVVEKFKEHVIYEDTDPKCSDPSTADDTCSRVIYLVVLDYTTWSIVHGTEKVPIYGFAKYWLDDPEPEMLKGKFLSFVPVDETDYTSPDDFIKLRKVKLID